MSRMKKATIGALILVVVLASFAMGESVQSFARAAAGPLKTFTDVLAIVYDKYVEEVKVTDLIYGALSGMLSGLDPHSAFMRPEEMRELSIDTEGRFGGLGIEISVRDNYIYVVSPIDDTPAAAAGIQPGDYIVKINGKSTRGMTLIDAVNQLRGPEGTKVKITVWRTGWNEPRDFELTRAVIVVKTVKFKVLEPGFGYIKISQFNAGTTDALLAALKELKKMDGGLKGLVLDLRNDPGGLLDQAVQVSDVFVDEGLIVSTRGRAPRQNFNIPAQSGGQGIGFPIVVLINAGTASASEIVAGCLQDHHRAIIVGERSFGKGSVQTIIPLGDGSGLRLTTAKYYTPNGRDIQAHGIDPDFVVAGDLLAGLDPNQRRALLREQDLDRHLQGGQEPQGPPEELGPPEEAPEPGAAPAASGDPQLDMALQILKAWPAFNGARTAQ